MDFKKLFPNLFHQLPQLLKSKYSKPDPTNDPTEESRDDDLVDEQDSWTGKGERNTGQDDGETGGEAAGDCLDLDEEKGAL